ncbi:MAG: WecB/TagA/CpsF family glycosyltransferase [Bacteroidota bacterium]|nr:WecB/TagA/CpsF family glycosyltransferase [Bacteroidota bacterium]
MDTLRWKYYDIFKGDISSISLGSKLLINTINQYSYCVAENNPLFKSALINSDVLLPDGIAIVAAVRLMLNKKIKKIAGADLHISLVNRCIKENRSCFYLGSSEATLSAIKNRINIDYPGLRVGFYSPPYKDFFTDSDNKKMIDAVNEFNPDVLFIGMTAPKQEMWANQFKAQLNAHLICTIGAVFDFYAQTVKRPDKIWINLGLEWFVRLLKEPKRMWKRYIYYGPVFLFEMAKPTNANEK